MWLKLIIKSLKTTYLFTPTKILHLFLLIFFSLFLEILGVALIIPISTILISPDKINYYKSLVNFNFFSKLNELNSFSIILVGFIFILLLRYIFTIITELLSIKVSRYIEIKINDLIIEKRFNDPWIEVLLSQNKSFTKTLMSDISIFTSQGIIPSLNIIKNFLIILTMVIYLFLIKGVVIFFLLIICLLLCFLFYQKSKKIFFMISSKYNLITESRYGFIDELVNGVREIKLYNLKNFYKKRYLNNENLFTKLEIIKKLISTLPKVILEFLLILSTVIIIILNYNTLDEIFPFLTLIFFISFRSLPIIVSTISMISSLQINQSQINLVVSALDKIKDISKNKVFTENLNSKNLVNFKKQDMILEIKNVSFSYRVNNRIFSGLNFTFKQGNIYALLGENGSGKSTLTDLLTGLLKPTTGAIFFNGININDFEDDWFLKVGYLSQTFFLFNETIKKNIILSSEENNFKKDLYEQSIKTVQLNDYINNLPALDNTEVLDHGKNLSGGQRQKIALARLLYKNTDVILLDEATSSLDRDSAKEICEVMQRIKKHKIIIIITHSDEVVKYCDKVIKINNQKFVE
jgi:ABC-type bacteriocin/lantibiotic exporter with double-glycine peptidase domain